MTPYSPRRRFETIFSFASMYILDFIFNFSSTMTFGNDLRRCAFAKTSETIQQHAPVIRHLTHHVLHIVYLLDCSHVVPSRGPHNPRWEYWELPMYIFWVWDISRCQNKIYEHPLRPYGVWGATLRRLWKWPDRMREDLRKSLCGNRFH